ncbi:hypothetical protein HPB47_011563 [Ixodes persulcatus]|uniref:Uncharacterized protein n=1 Tax=Ixodes persulcatus TaxID=34615 RepID=A0AC60NVY3_IXOPE|nr:hypothetical protein HPB47_011563 [Ixodes persulcatus]
MDTLVVVRGKCFRSQKKTGKPYCVTGSVAADGTVEDSSCECAAKESLCNHAFALLRLVVVLKGQGYEEPPPEVSCTELPQQWRRPRGPQIAATSVDDVDWRSVREGGRSTPIDSRLYDAWKHPMDADEVQQAARDLGNNLCALGATPFAKHLRCVQVFGTGFTFGRVSVGSPLSYQYPVSPHEFVTYVSPNIDLHARDASASKSPTVPQLFHSSSIFDPSTRGLADARFRILQELSLTPELASQLEKNSRQQSKSAVWKTARRNRLTASAFGNVKTRQSWTTDRLRSFASDKDLSRVRAIKHGITHEPDAVTKYEKELRRLGHDIQVSCCGLFVDPASPWLGASPDRVVFHATEAVPHGVVEMKCPYTMWLAPSPDVKGFYMRSPPRARSASPIPSPVRRQLSAEPETRTSRRIKGEDPEYGQLLDKPKPKKTTMANQAQTPAAPAILGDRPQRPGSIGRRLDVTHPRRRLSNVGMGSPSSSAPNNQPLGRRMCGARPIDDHYVITVVRPITSTGGARTDKWASEVLRRTTLAQDTANARVTSRNTSVALRHQRRQHHEVQESCGQAPAWNPFAQLFAQPSALSTTEPAAESA